MDVDTIRNKLTVGEIRTELRRYKLPIYGTKVMLIDRLVSYLEKASLLNSSSSTISLASNANKNELIRIQNIQQNEKINSNQNQLKVIQLENNANNQQIYYFKANSCNDILQNEYFHNYNQEQQEVISYSNLSYDDQIKQIEELERQLVFSQSNQENSLATAVM